MPAIEIDNLSKVYEKNVVALDGLTLSVPEGSIFGLLGPNGAGKTTTLKILMGLAIPTSGDASVGGYPIQSPEIKEIVGFLPEDPAAFGWMNAYEFLTFTGRLFGLPKEALDDKVDELIEQVDLSSEAHRRVSGYSKGMRQRLGLAAALINDPEILILDEPCSSLDPIGRRETLDLIDGFRKERTVLMASHILEDVERVCDQVAIINQGKLVTQSSRQELKEKFGHLKGPVFEMEFESAPTELVEKLKKLNWVQSVQVENAVLNLKAADPDRAKQELPRLAAEAGPTLISYQVKAPSLEEIFIDLVQEK